jgi:hypothetical protein
MAMSDTTRIEVVRDADNTAGSARVLQAVQQAVQGNYEVLGELGRSDPEAGVVVYLARQAGTGVLVALRVRPADGAQGSSREMWLDVVRQLDASTPGPRETCVGCGKAVGSWDRFCGSCGADLTAGEPGDGSSPEALLEAVRNAAGARYEVLGQMNRSDGGGIVYFARERKTGNLTALRLRREAAPSGSNAPQYSLGRTTVLKSVAESLGVVHGGPPPRSPAPPPTPGPTPPKPPVQPAPPAPPPPAAAHHAGHRDAWILGGLAAVVVVATVILVRGNATRHEAADTTASAQKDSVPTPTTTPTPSPAPAQITIGGTLPPAAVVTVDSAPVSPPTISVPAGQHTFRVAAPGYEPVAQVLTLAAGQQMVWTPELTAHAAAPTTPVRHAVSSSHVHAPAGPSPVRTLASSNGSTAPTTPGGSTDSLAQQRTTTNDATCASLFSTLEWNRALPVCQAEATAGNVASERTLGTLYDRGLGTEVNPKQAAVWYKSAADAGDQIAQYRLGALYRDGNGVKRDPKTALDLFQKSANQGDADAQSAMGTAYERGDGVKRDYVQAVAWYQKAALQGHPGAGYRLGVLYEQGKGVAQSDSMALVWWRKAAAAGEPAAQAALAKRKS